MGSEVLLRQLEGLLEGAFVSSASSLMGSHPDNGYNAVTMSVTP